MMGKQPGRQPMGWLIWVPQSCHMSPWLAGQLLLARSRGDICIKLDSLDCKNMRAEGKPQ